MSMMMVARLIKSNGTGDLMGTISILNDKGKTQWEDVVNLSKEKSRAAFVAEVAERTHTSRDEVERGVLSLIDGHREVELRKIQEREELLRPMPTEALADDVARCDIQRGKERRRPVTSVVVRPPFGMSEEHRQDRLASIERLDL